MAAEIILSKETMSSIEVSELTGKQHAHVMRDIRSLLEQGVSESNFGLSSYKQPQPNGGFKEVACYKLTKKGSLILASGYNAVLREKIIDRWEALETGKATPIVQQLPQDYLSALKALVASEEEKQLLQLENKQQQEKIEKLEEMTAYTRMVLNSPSTVLVTQIAQDYGMSAMKFNAKLRDLRIQRFVNRQWILYGKYLDKGYVQSKTHDFNHRNGSADVSLTTTWTQKGRLFLYNELKKVGIIPLIEQNHLFQEGGRYAD